MLLRDWDLAATMRAVGRLTNRAPCKATSQPPSMAVARQSTMNSPASLLTSSLTDHLLPVHMLRVLELARKGLDEVSGELSVERSELVGRRPKLGRRVVRRLQRDLSMCISARVVMRRQSTDEIMGRIDADRGRSPVQVFFQSFDLSQSLSSVSTSWGSARKTHLEHALARIDVLQHVSERPRRVADVLALQGRGVGVDAGEAVIEVRKDGDAFAAIRELEL